MIIYKSEGLTIYERRSDCPGTDWTGKAELVLDESTSEGRRLAKKVEKYAPFVSFIYDDNGAPVEVEEDQAARAAWEAAQPKPEEPTEPDAPEGDGSAVTWDELAAAYTEGVNSI